VRKGTLFCCFKKAQGRERNKLNVNDIRLLAMIIIRFRWAIIIIEDVENQELALEQIKQLSFANEWKKKSRALPEIL
jgi:hypothetical protein